MANQKSLQDTIDFYILRYAYQDPSLEQPPHPDTKTIVVIPCFNEPDILATLNSLKQCKPPQYPVEIIIVINASTEAEAEIIDRNHQTIGQVLQWQETEKPEFLNLHLLVHNALPHKEAGVGLARKIGMDEAASRFAPLNFDGAIICLDADCTVSNDYLQQIEKNFALNRDKNLTVIYFEHEIENLEHETVREGIIHYELFLRYYVRGLEYAGYPFAWHTIGSCMGVKPSLYAAQGGMNKRKAAEDFYFIHKLANHANFLALNQTIVYPSSRKSDRVPFGTGKAQEKWEEGDFRYAKGYDPDIFETLKDLITTIPSFYNALDTDHCELLVRQLPESLQVFLKENEFEEALQRIKSGVTSFEAYEKKMFEWLDGFRVLKLVHFLRDHYLPNQNLTEASYTLLGKKGMNDIKNRSEAYELLKIYRKLDRSPQN